jgi:predicted mannosyl-3-phosphoglycerate phosphatase (HAD superfamily)
MMNIPNEMLHDRLGAMKKIVLTSFQCDAEILNFKEPLVLTPVLSESGQFIVLNNDSLGISVVAETREELLQELQADLEMLWRYCAMQPDEKLGEEFRKYKRNLLELIKT